MIYGANPRGVVYIETPLHLFSDSLNWEEWVSGIIYLYWYTITLYVYGSTDGYSYYNRPLAIITHNLNEFTYDITQLLNS